MIIRVLKAILFKATLVMMVVVVVVLLLLKMMNMGMVVLMPDDGNDDSGHNDDADSADYGDVDGGDGTVDADDGDDVCGGDQSHDDFIIVLCCIQVKQQENEDALKLFSQRLHDLDKLPDEQRQVSLIRGLLAGNVFDWGAKEVAE
jgi:hypothetical protein